MSLHPTLSPPSTTCPQQEDVLGAGEWCEDQGALCWAGLGWQWLMTAELLEKKEIGCI